MKKGYKVYTETSIKGTRVLTPISSSVYSLEDIYRVIKDQLVDNPDGIFVPIAVYYNAENL